MQITNISEAKAQLSALIEKVIAGEEVIIGKAGKPVARLIRYERNRQARQPGALQGKITIADDFDALPEDIADQSISPLQSRLRNSCQGSISIRSSVKRGCKSRETSMLRRTVYSSLNLRSPLRWVVFANSVDFTSIEIS